MSGFLLDVNVLIALIDPAHVHHDRAHDWFTGTGSADWLSCPTTQNGVIRIVSHPRYANAQPSPGPVIESLRSLARTGSHRFVPDDLSLLDDTAVRTGRLLSSAQVTDTYLLARAAALGAVVATFDQRFPTSAVNSGDAHLTRIR